MTTVKEVQLIKVRTLTKSHAKQIEVIEYDPHPNSFFTQVALLTHPERGDYRTQVLGWINGEVLKNELKLKAINGSRKYWLVNHDDQLYWFPAPVKGEAFEFFKESHLMQLFV